MVDLLFHAHAKPWAWHPMLTCVFFFLRRSGESRNCTATCGILPARVTCGHRTRATFLLARTGDIAYKIRTDLARATGAVMRSVLRPAFTLIELLVVIAIIAILIGLLL